MGTFVILIVTNIWFAVAKIVGNRKWDRQLKWKFPTYERTACNCHSDTYQLMSKMIIIVHIGSLISLFLEFVLHNLGNTSLICSVAGVFSFAYMFDTPVHVFLIYRANKRAKLWDELSNHKKKLTLKERRRVQEEFDKRLKRR